MKKVELLAPAGSLEKAKIACARKLFSETSSGKVKYKAVANFEELREILMGK